ncbi:hypothetical protein E9549_11295 [Blastococcus sp. MG754426]|uniref:hypothetical protein n=1 Tax=unclassified Blastococcus TaxID=2619396 RepID=UPI001EF0113F|nr:MULTISPECIES: hypothetical protein [unclassified Blastococcus]MCF6507984.1 hypothetical protein [Blastococcus sp. MG754426]MCF6512646.1 hypothetical protein [Blastococcus sp. MG754427]MCF6734040.1 hypothetical protein [Blastococcus sp. KM273129]
MARSTRPRLVRRTVAAFAIAAASLTTAACGEDVVDDGVEQNVEEGVEDAEQEVEDTEQEVED